MQSSRNTFIGDEGTRGVSGGERRRVSIGVDIIHGPSLLFLDEPTSGLDSTNAHSVIDKVHHIARAGSTVILTIHQPSHRILMLLDHLIVLARGELIFQGSPKDVARHLGRMGRKVPKGENSLEYLLDVIQEYDQSELGVGVLANFCITGMKPPPVTDEVSISTVPPTPSPLPSHHQAPDQSDRRQPGRRLHLNAFDHSVRTSPWTSSSFKAPWSGTHSGVMETITFTPLQQQQSSDRRALTPPPGYVHRVTCYFLSRFDNVLRIHRNSCHKWVKNKDSKKG